MVPSTPFSDLSDLMESSMARETDNVFFDFVQLSADGRIMVAGGK